MIPRAVRTATLVWMVGASAVRAQTLDLSAPERPALTHSALIDLVEQLNSEIADLEDKLGSIAGADEDLLLPMRVELRARLDATHLLTPWLDAYSDGWATGVAGLTIAGSLAEIDALAMRYAELSLAARSAGAPEEAVVAYQRARASLRRYIDDQSPQAPATAQGVRLIDLRYNALARAWEAMHPDRITPVEPPPEFNAALDQIRGAVLDDATRAACLALAEALASNRQSAQTVRTRARIADALARAVWAPSLARVECGQTSPTPEVLAAGLRAAAEGQDTRAIERLALAASVFRRIGDLRRSGVDVRTLPPAIEQALAAGDATPFLTGAERALEASVRARRLPDFNARTMPRDLQKGWRLAARAFEAGEAAVFEELIEIARNPGRLRDPGAVSRLASHQALVQTMRRVADAGGWREQLASRADAASLAAMTALEELTPRTLDALSADGAGGAGGGGGRGGRGGAERLGVLEGILQGLDPDARERALATPGSWMDRAAAGHGRELARVFALARAQRLSDWARQNDAQSAGVVRLHERLLDLIALLGLANDHAALARIDVLGAIELDPRGIAAAAQRLTRPVEEAIEMVLRGETPIAADAIAFAESRAGVLRLLSALSRHAGAVSPRRPIEECAPAGALDAFDDNSRRELAMISRLLLEAGALANSDVDARSAVDAILDYAEHTAARLADRLRPEGT